MRNNSRAEVNDVVRDYKKKIITKSEAIEKIAKMMNPLYISTSRKMTPFDMSANSGGDLKNVYLETISYSLDMFKFSVSPFKGDVFSFIPYFKTMFNNRTNNFLTDLMNRLEESNRLDYIDEKYSEVRTEDDSGTTALPNSLTCNIDQYVDNDKKLMEHIKSNLTSEEWYIFDHKIRSFSFASIEKKMVTDRVPFRKSHQMIYKKWGTIQHKVFGLIKGWKDASSD